MAHDITDVKIDMFYLFILNINNIRVSIFVHITTIHYSLFTFVKMILHITNIQVLIVDSYQNLPDGFSQRIDRKKRSRSYNELPESTRKQYPQI